jgi:hypothetical protein
MPTKKLPTCCRRTSVGGYEQLIIETAAGQRITLTDGPVTVVIEDSNGNSISLNNGNMTLSTPGKLVLQAALVEINGSSVAINAAILQCSGVVKADTLEANTVVASNYTPGAANIW